MLVDDFLICFCLVWRLENPFSNPPIFFFAKDVLCNCGGQCPKTLAEAKALLIHSPFAASVTQVDLHMNNFGKVEWKYSGTETKGPQGCKNMRVCTHLLPAALQNLSSFCHHSLLCVWSHLREAFHVIFNESSPEWLQIGKLTSILIAEAGRMSFLVTFTWNSGKCVVHFFHQRS